MKNFSIVAFIIFHFSTLVFAGLTHTITFDRSDLEIITEGDYHRLLLDGLGHFSNEGAPELPVKTINLIIPAGNSVSTVKINSNKLIKISGFYNIYPTQSPIPTSINAKKPEWVEPDLDIYLSSEIYPKNIVQVVSEGYFDGSTRIITLLISPIQYLPVTGEIWFSEEITFTVNYKGCNDISLKPNKRSLKNQLLYDQILNNYVDNKKDITSYQVKHNSNGALGKSNTVQSGPLPAYEYVVITSNSLKSSFKNLYHGKYAKVLTQESSPLKIFIVIIALIILQVLRIMLVQLDNI